MKINLSKLIMLLGLVTLVMACNKNQIDYIGRSQISGSLSFQNSTGSYPAPIGSLVSVRLNNSVDPTYTFKTTEKGRYKFSPQVKGTYIFDFTVMDTVMQYNAALRQKVDLDSARASIRLPIAYTKTSEPAVFSVTQSNVPLTKDVVVTGSLTGVKIIVTDEQGNPVRDARVCLYLNRDFADKNSPNCAGSVAYLSTDGSGAALFLGLEAKSYYFNARASVGSVSINNQWSAEMKLTGQLQSGMISSKTISLK